MKLCKQFEKNKKHYIEFLYWHIQLDNEEQLNVCTYVHIHKT